MCKDGAQSSDTWYKKWNTSQQPLTNWKAGGRTDFLNNVTIAQRSWIFHNDSATKKTGCSEDKEPISLLEKARMSCLKVRTFFYVKCIWTMNIFQQGKWSTSVSTEMFWSVLRQKLCHKTFLASQVGCSLPVKKFLAQKQITIVKHQPRFPDIASCQLFVYKIITFHEGNQFWQCALYKEAYNKVP